MQDRRRRSWGLRIAVTLLRHSGRAARHGAVQMPLTNCSAWSRWKRRRHGCNGRALYEELKVPARAEAHWNGAASAPTARGEDRAWRVGWRRRDGLSRRTLNPDSTTKPTPSRPISPTWALAGVPFYPRTAREQRLRVSEIRSGRTRIPHSIFATSPAPPAQPAGALAAADEGVKQDHERATRFNAGRWPR